MRPRILPAGDAASILSAVAALRRQQPIAAPTETVYALAADASDPQAVARIFALKGRPSFNPLIIHCLDAAQAFAIGARTAIAEKLAERFWPGPLSMILQYREGQGVCPQARAGLDSVALRVPEHRDFRALLAAFGKPLAAPSANRSGRISPVCAEHVAEDLNGLIEIILDGGPCQRGLESSIIDARHDRPLLLRPGAITGAELGAEPFRSNPEQPLSPGQTLRHYAPDAALRLNIVEPRPGEPYLAFGEIGTDITAPWLNLSPRGDLEEAAANLFAMLRELDKQQSKTIAIAPIPEQGLGEAINDRLQRAASRI